MVSISIQFSEKLSECLKYWVRRCAADSSLPLPICQYRESYTQFTAAYLKLVVLSYGFQCAIKNGISRDNPIVQQSISVARTVMQQMIEHLYPTGNLKYATETAFFLLLNESQQKNIILSVRKLIQVLGSKLVALDDRHTPALYARFLSSQLAVHNVFTDSEIYGTLRVDDIIPQHRQGRRQTSPAHLPDVKSVQQHSKEQIAASQQPGVVLQQYGDADMDFGVHHFMDAMKTHNNVN